MKKKILITAIVVILLVILVPIPMRLRDGGTIEYKALIYTVSKVHKLNHNSASEYDNGIIIKIFGKEIYNNVPNSITKTYNEEAEKNYSKTIDNINIELSIPNDWNYEEVFQNKENNSYKFALKLYKKEKSKNAVLYFYNNPFGVCGTGRTTEKIYLNNGTEAVVGYYDNNENWSDVSFYKLNHNIALINCGLEGTEAKEVLEFIKTINIKL